ncbi:MAG: DUF1559 domain-containing protein [Thermoguttaceae bacterium]|nr:DUF1559 domain-containing protein [Thermoguttaceae bacterium]
MSETLTGPKTVSPFWKVGKFFLFVLLGFLVFGTPVKDPDFFELRFIYWSDWIALVLFIRALLVPFETRILRTARVGCLILLFLMLVLSSLPNAWHAAIRMQNNNNLKGLSLAFLEYAEEHGGTLPPHRVGAEPDANGHFPHSWRVYLLPYLGENELFGKIRLNEPWDSAWNRQFHDQMPKVFRNPYFSQTYFPGPGREKIPPKSASSYCVCVGEGALFPENGPGPNVSEFTGRKHLTFLVAESDPACWMDPAHDIFFPAAFADPAVPRGFRIYGNSYKTFSVSMLDGSVQNTDDVKDLLKELDASSEDTSRSER